jgi:hypothetical protein
MGDQQLPLHGDVALHSCVTEHPMPLACMRVKCQKPVYSRDFWMQCCEKEGDLSISLSLLVIVFACLLLGGGGYNGDRRFGGATP